MIRWRCIFPTFLLIPVNLAGLPALSLPAKTDGLPVGFQLIGKPFREADILGIGRFFEESVQGLI